MIEAKYYSQKGDRLICELCPRFCRMKEGQEGYCFARKNIAGKLIAVNYGLTPSVSLDPIEKKPMYHFMPGSRILSTGPNGCNLGCKFCQNWQISQTKLENQYYAPSDLKNLADAKNSIGISYTYSEPLIWYEYIMDTGKIVQESGMFNILVSNGYINEEPLMEILPLIDGMNIDLKSMNPGFYKKECSGNLEDVLRTIKIAAEHCVAEVTHLVVTGKNDNTDEFKDLVDFLNSVSSHIPLHISRYFPNYKTSEKPTSEKLMLEFFDIASEKLKYVYMGNTYLKEGRNTICPRCGELLVERTGFHTTQVNIDGGICKKCGAGIYGKFLSYA